MNDVNNQTSAFLKMFDGLEKIVEDRVKQYIKNSIKIKEVKIVKIYNVNSFTKRTVDVVSLDSPNSPALKDIPVNIPQDIAVGDTAILMYFGDRYSNGWIVSLIESKATGNSQPINLDLIPDLEIYKITGLQEVIDEIYEELSRKVSDIALQSVYKYKGTVATIIALPDTNNSIGDVYTVASNKQKYEWNGTKWVIFTDMSSKADLVGGKVPIIQLPDFIIPLANRGVFPTYGESGKIYIAVDTKYIYYWDGSNYLVISDTLGLGETSTTAYPGIKGKSNADNITNIINGTTTVGKASNTTKVAGNVVEYYSAYQFLTKTPVSGVHYIVYEDL